MNDWVELGMQPMKDARKAKGWSYEGLARQIPVASKTYERYEKAGRLPRHLVLKFADLTDLEIDEPTRSRLTVPAAPGLVEEIRVLRVQLERLIDRLDQQVAPQEPEATTQSP